MNINIWNNFLLKNLFPSDAVSHIFVHIFNSDDVCVMSKTTKLNIYLSEYSDCSLRKNWNSKFEKKTFSRNKTEFQAVVYKHCSLTLISVFWAIWFYADCNQKYAMLQ